METWAERAKKAASSHTALNREPSPALTSEIILYSWNVIPQWLCGYQKTASKVYVESPKTHKSQNSKSGGLCCSYHGTVMLTEQISRSKEQGREPGSRLTLTLSRIRTKAPTEHIRRTSEKRDRDNWTQTGQQQNKSICERCTLLQNMLNESQTYIKCKTIKGKVSTEKQIKFWMA